MMMIVIKMTSMLDKYLDLLTDIIIDLINE